MNLINYALNKLILLIKFISDRALQFFISMNEQFLATVNFYPPTFVFPSYFLFLVFLWNIQCIISFQKMPINIATTNITIPRKKSIIKSKCVERHKPELLSEWENIGFEIPG